VIRVLLADDHAIVRAGLKEILADTGDIEVAGEAANGQEVLARVSSSVSMAPLRNWISGNRCRLRSIALRRRR